MPIVTISRADLFGTPLDEERHELLLFQGELREWPEHYKTAKYMLPLIGRRLEEIQAERKNLSLPESDPLEYAEKERDYELEIDAQRSALDGRDGISA